MNTPSRPVPSERLVPVLIDGLDLSTRKLMLISSLSLGDLLVVGGIVWVGWDG